MSAWLVGLTAIMIAYLFGSISSAIIVCRLMGLPDPRTQGSENPGATNVLRIGGKKAAAITLLGDLLKGLIPVALAVYLQLGSLVIGLVALAAFLGHLFPIFFGFKGGKGVATALGCLLGLYWPIGLCWIATWLVVALISRYSSLAALVAAALTPLYVWFFTHQLLYVDVFALISLILIYRHRSNIRQLLAGSERRIGRRA